MSSDFPKLRIAHVVAVYSQDGAYGGPTRVAFAQAKQLARSGHDVTVFAGWMGEGNPPTRIDGLPVVLRRVRRVMPKVGFAGLIAPGLWRAIRRRLTEFDIVHVHLARDLITMPIARVAAESDVRLILQTHGMIVRSANPLALPIDRTMTRHVLRKAARVLTLTEEESVELANIAKFPVPTEVLDNGVSLPEIANRPYPTAREVIFLARLHARKRPAAFVAAAIDLAPSWPDVTFTLVGPDGGEAAAVVEQIRLSGVAGDQIRWTGPAAPDEVIERISRAEIYVLPAIAEPFGLTLLEAMSAGVPVVLGQKSTLASVISEADAGRVFDESPGSLASAIESFLRDPDAATHSGRNGRRLVESRWSISAVVGKLDEIYAATTRATW